MEGFNTITNVCEEIRNLSTNGIIINDIVKIKGSVSYKNFFDVNGSVNISKYNPKDKSFFRSFAINNIIINEKIKEIDLENTKRLSFTFNLGECFKTYFFQDNYYLYNYYYKSVNKAEEFQNYTLSYIIDNLDAIIENSNLNNNNKELIKKYKKYINISKIWVWQNDELGLGKSFVDSLISTCQKNGYVENPYKKKNINNIINIWNNYKPTYLEIKGPWIKIDGNDEVPLIDTVKVLRPEQLKNIGFV
jgi:hypothetical protein